MKRIVILSLILVVTISAIAQQVQQGYVKTIGRPGRAGVSLDGVVVRISGNINDALSNSEGKFSFPIREKRFKFSRISKKGYELADKDFLHYDYGYIPNAPIVIALVSKAELQREKEIMEESTRNKLEVRFQKEIAILERKLEKLQISSEEVARQQLAIHEKYDNIDTLVSTLSERFLRTDYDNIDSLNLRINQCITDGELERAQQLILSKGSYNERKKELEETRNLRLLTQKREEKMQNELAEDEYQLYKIAQSQGRYDSAYIHLENRYGVDTTQVNYLKDLAFFEFRVDDFPVEERMQREKKHEGYLFKLYDSVKSLDNSQSEKSLVEYRIGTFYSRQANYPKALQYYEESLTTLSKVEDKTISEAIADIHYIMGEKEHALKEYLATEKCYGTPQNSDVQDIKKMYSLQVSIAGIYMGKGMEKEAMAYYKKAVNNAECYFQLTSESRCIEHIILINERMEKIYASRGNYKQVYACAENSIHYAEIYMKRFPSSYSRLLYAEVLCRMADARANIGKTSNVEQELIKCLKMSEFASNIFKSRYRQLTYNIYNAFATNFYKQKMYKEALNAVNKSIKLLPNEIQAYHRKLDILKAVGEKEEAKNVDRILKQIEGNI